MKFRIDMENRGPQVIEAEQFEVGDDGTLTLVGITGRKVAAMSFGNWISVRRLDEENAE